MHSWCFSYGLSLLYCLLCVQGPWTGGEMLARMFRALLHVAIRVEDYHQFLFLEYINDQYAPPTLTGPPLQKQMFIENHIVSFILCFPLAPFVFTETAISAPHKMAPKVGPPLPAPKSRNFT